MTPGARLSAAISILDAFLREERVLIEPLLKGWGRGARYAGSKDRAAVADLVYAALRRLGSARLGAESADARAAVLGSLRLEGVEVEELEALCDAGPHRPEKLTVEEKERLVALPQRAAEAPFADFPEWLLDELQASLPSAKPEIAALANRAALDFRVNSRKGGAAEAAKALKRDGIATEPGPYSPLALRAIDLGASSRPKLSAMQAYQTGLVEPQDAASQAIALLSAALCDGEGGGLAIDACAGGGGKTLAMAAALPPDTRLCAFDVDARRMRDLPERLRRAGAAAEILERGALARLSGCADMVLVDAPCSGSGAWARQPDAKWRLSPERLEKLQSMQGEALDLGAELVRPGGALVYATCSLFNRENSESLRRFLLRQPEFEPIDLGPAWIAAGLRDRPSPPENSAFSAAAVLFPPSHRGTDGFYVAALRRGARR